MGGGAEVRGGGGGGGVPRPITVRFGWDMLAAAMGVCAGGAEGRGGGAEERSLALGRSSKASSPTSAEAASMRWYSSSRAVSLAISSLKTLRW